MDNVTIKSLSVENFASFANRVDFTTAIDTSKHECLDNAFINGDISYNKVSFVYGANGSGKTFFCKIVREIQRLLDWSPLTAINNPQLLTMPPFKGIDAPVKSFAFDAGYKDKPTSFGIEIVIDGTIYNYSFSIMGKRITHELLTKKHRRTEKLLERTSSSNQSINLRSELKSFESSKQVVRDEALCLPVAAMFNNSLASKIIRAIKGIPVVSMTAARLEPVQSEDSFSRERINKYIRIIKKADPTIRDMDISFSEEEISRQRVDGDDFENREIIATRTTVGVDTRHALFSDGKEVGQTSIPFLTEESLGTVKLFTALPYLFDILESGGVLIVDEIENGMHLSLVKEIISLFTNDATNPRHAQLICTSHQPLLLDGDFRRDQVWIACKDTYGKSTLHRLSEIMKTQRAKVNLTARLLDGAFGCNPSRFFENNT